MDCYSRHCLRCNPIFERCKLKKCNTVNNNTIKICLLKQHPGGDDLIIDEGGKDCTKVFDDFGHSNDAKQIMKQFKIGELVEVFLKFV